jgi:hypothetical protein
MQGIDSPSHYSLADRCGNPVPTRFLAVKDCSIITAQTRQAGGIYSLESIPVLLQRLQNRALV